MGGSAARIEAFTVWGQWEDGDAAWRGVRIRFPPGVLRRRGNLSTMRAPL